MDELMLFTDGSVNTQTKVGYGAYLFVIDTQLSLDQLSQNINLKRFEQTSSTKLELQILLWALTHTPISSDKITVFTDSQNIVGLPARRKKLELNQYCTKNNSRLKQAMLYQQFFKIIQPLDIKFVKVHGHLASQQKDKIDQLFALVDKASRRALRNSYEIK